MTGSDRPPPQDLEYSASDGVSLKLRRLGNEGGIRLVVSHGNGFAVDGYRVFWEPLLERFDVVLLDIRNHGHNPPSGADGHHYRQIADDIGRAFAAITEAWGAKSTVGVFHSMSSRAAMKLAVEHGAPWDAVALFDPPSVPPPDHPLYEGMRTFELRLIEFALNRRERFEDPAELARWFGENRASRGWLPEAREDMARAVLRRDDAGWTLACRRELEASIYLAALTLDLWPQASSLGAPARLIGADPQREGNTPTARANEALAREGGYRYEAIAGTGHLLQIERPEPCRSALIELLREAGLDG